MGTNRAARPACGPAAWRADGQATYEGGGEAGLGDGFIGVLDTLSILPVAAHSINRLLTVGHLGNALIRMTRASDNAEMDFGADGDGVLDYAAIATWLDGSSGCISTIYDQIGSANLVESAANVGLYVPAAINASRAVVHLDASSKQLGTALAIGPLGNGAHCIVAVAACLSTSNNSVTRMLGIGDFSSSSSIEKSVNSDGSIKQWSYGGGFNGSKSGSATADQAFHYWVKRHASGITVGRVSGAADYSGSITYALDALTFDWNNDGAPANNFGGNTKLAESLVFNGDVSGGDQILIETDLAGFYGL